MPDVKNYIDPAAAAYMRTVIAEAGGNEVFFIGSCGDERRVMRAGVVARGDEECVPAIAQNAAVGDVVIHNHPSGVLTPSGPDLDIASMLGSRGVGFFIINNEATDVYAVVEPFAKEAIKPLDVSEARSALGPDGALANILDGY